MIRTVLLAAAAAVTLGLDCTLQPVDNCTAALGCMTRDANCYRTGEACNTTSTICSGDGCSEGPVVVDSQSCSKCSAQCETFVTNATCPSSRCAWAPARCVSVPGPSSRPCADRTKAACVGGDSCLWVSYSNTLCGQSTTFSLCTQCNFTGFPSGYPSALKNNQGRSCTWPAVAPYTSSYSLTITDVAQTSTCATFLGPRTEDASLLTSIAKTGFFSGLRPFNDPAITVTCTAGLSLLSFLSLSLSLTLFFYLSLSLSLSLKHTHTHTYTHTHVCTHAHTLTGTHTHPLTQHTPTHVDAHTHTHTHTQTHTHTHPHKHTHIHTHHTHTRTHTHAHTHMPAHMHTQHTHTHTHNHTRTHTHTHTRTHTHTHTHKHTHTHTRHTHTHTHTHAHTHTHTHARTHTLFNNFISVTLD